MFKIAPLFLIGSIAFAEVPTTNPTFSEHLVESSSTDILLRDRYSKSQTQKVETISSSGGLSENIDSNLPYTVTQQKTPGTQSSFVGFGRSSADTNVQTLGVPLNSAQGGGFDLSSFPSFLWNSTRYQVGPSVAAYDPQGVGGTLSLKLWTDEALSESMTNYRVTSMASTAKVAQFSAGASYAGTTGSPQPRVAIQAGGSVGKMKGPAGSISGRWGDSKSVGQIHGKYHLLASGMDSETPGSKSFPSPDAHQITQRLIPVFETGYAPSADWLLKNTLFYDSTVLKVEDVTSGLYARDAVQQGGTEIVAVNPNWLLSGGYRSVNYQSVGFGEKDDQNYHFGAAYRFMALEHEWQPALRGVGQGDAGLKPAGSVGARHDYFDEPGLQLFHYVKASYQPRFASLLDRYYSLSSPGFTFRGNPDLKIEDTYTYTLGGELKRSMFGVGLEGNYQQRQNVQINETTVGLTGVTTTPKNKGDAWLASLSPTVSFYPVRWLDLHHSTVFNASHIDQTDSEIPYIPHQSHVSRLVVHEPGLEPFWSVQTAFHAATGSHVSARTRTTGYGLLDLTASIGSRSLRFSAKVDNLTDRVIEWVPDYPGPGRTYSVGFSALF